MKTVMRTHSGIAFDLARPLPQDVSPLDIARHLSQIKRFTGAGHGAGYTVAEHSVHVYRIVEEILPGQMPGPDRAEMLRAALFHDAHEAYIGDWSTPLKNLVGRHVVAEARLAVDLAIGKRIGFRELLLHSPEVKCADAAALIVERDHSMAPALSPEKEDWPVVGDYPLTVARQVVWSTPAISPDNAFKQFRDIARKIGVDL